MVTVKELKRKICLLGDWGVGKTSLIRKFVLDIFEDKYIVTLGTKVTKKRIKFKVGNGNIIDLNLVIWDVMGQEQFKKIQTSAYQGTHGAIIVCDITRRDTLENLARWRNMLFKITKNVPIIVLANKTDLKGQERFSLDELAMTAQKLNAKHFLTSAKTGQNVETAFKSIGMKLIK